MLLNFTDAQKLKESFMQDVTSENNQPLVQHELTKIERRILGTLVEKGMTTPEQYPLTLNSLHNGCNQKSNRDPVTQYDEDAISDAIEQLMKKGWMLSVQTTGGRTERYRHQLRVKLTLNEMELAILVELMLRGRQQLGELRTRASRMSNIETQELLKGELENLLKKGYIQASDSLSRKGVEIDHAFYTKAEQERHAQQGTAFKQPQPTLASEENEEPAQLAEQNELAQLKIEVAELKQRFHELSNEFNEIKKQLM